jgi:hypothetical protein
MTISKADIFLLLSASNVLISLGRGTDAVVIALGYLLAKAA